MKKGAYLPGLLTALVGVPAWAARLENPSVLNVASPNAAEVASLFWWVIGFSVLVLVVVVVFMGVGIYQAARDKDHDSEPPQTHGNLTLEVTWTVLPLAILAVLLVLTVRSIYTLDGFAAPEDSLEVNVVGQQFWWEVSYLEQGIVTANELVLPIGRPVKINLASKDVMHSFWAPNLAGKTDLIPGNKRTLWFTPDKEGLFFGHCAELCGDSHANMRFRVLVLSEEEWSAWAGAASQPARITQSDMQSVDEADVASVRQGAQLFQSKGCVGCHPVTGLNTYNRVGPDLSHVGSRTTIAAGILENNRENLVSWLLAPEVIKPGNEMPNLGLEAQEAGALADYLLALKLPLADQQELEQWIGSEEASLSDLNTRGVDR